MGVRFKRNLTGREALAPGEYFTDYLRHQIDQMCTCYVCCPSCGGIDALSDKHVVQKSGAVVPGWKCPTATCAFFEFITLEGFGEPVR